jgi:hypothetical protein
MALHAGSSVSLFITNKGYLKATYKNLEIKKLPEFRQQQEFQK